MSLIPEPPHVILAPDGVFLDPPGEIVSNKALVVQGSTIVRIATLDEARRNAPQGTPVLDLSGHVLVPGLMNTHVHLCFSGQADPRGDYHRDVPETRVARAVKNAATLLQSGVTTVRDCGSDWSILALHQIAALDIEQMPNLVLCGPPITATGGHLHQMGGEADGVDEIRKLTRLLHKRGANSIKMMATGGQMTPGTLPEAPSFTLEEMRAAVSTAREFGLSTVAHVLASEGIRLAAQAGFDSLEHCAYFERHENGLLARRYDEEIAHEVRTSGASAMIGVAASYRTLEEARNGNYRTPQEEFLLEQEENMFAIVRTFFELGVPIVCGTDAGVKNTHFNETWLELSLLVKRGGLSPTDALRVATSNAARALRIERIAGRIKPGYRADLIAVRQDPTQTPDAFRNVTWVMRGGTIVKGGAIAA